MRLKVFVTDGAMGLRGLTEDFFARFAQRGQRVQSSQAEQGENRVKSFLRRGVAGLSAVPVREAEEFFQGLSVEPGVVRLLEFCRSRGIELSVIGDGLGYCLASVLARNGIQDVRTYANRTEVEVDGGRARFSVSFPYDDAECAWCACCARNIMLTTCGDDDRIVFVGSEERDVCPAGYADVVFARGALQSACQARNISYLLYSSLDDVVESLVKLAARRNLRPRREAAMKRRDAFIAEW